MDGIGVGLLVLLAVACGAMGTYRVLAPRLALADARASEAESRLLAAWKDGYTVPELTQSSPAPLPELSAGVQEWLTQFDEAGITAYTAKARRLAQQGYTEAELLATLERGRFVMDDAA